MKSLGVIIANYNTSEFLVKCVENLLKIKAEISDKYDLNVTVIDNGSTDDSVQVATESFGQLIKLIPTQNKGLAVAHNMGLKSSDNDYYLFLGTDAFPTSEALLACLAFIEASPEVGLVTPRLVLRDGTPDMDAHRGFPTPWSAITHFSFLNRVFKGSNVFNQYFMGNSDLSSRHEIDLCISHFMLIRREVFAKVGQWDEDFFVFGEDVDMCYRIKQAGYKIFYLGDITVLHVKGVSVGRATASGVTKADGSVRKSMANASVNAFKLFYKKHYFEKYPKPLTWLVFLGITMMGWLRQVLVKFK